MYTVTLCYCTMIHLCGRNDTEGIIIETEKPEAMTLDKAIAKAADLVKDWELDYMDGIDGITGEILFTVRP